MGSWKACSGQVFVSSAWFPPWQLVQSASMELDSLGRQLFSRDHFSGFHGDVRALQAVNRCRKP